MKEVCELIFLLKKHFVTDAAGIMQIARMVLALMKVGTVCLREVAGGFAGETLISSDEKRIRRFPEDFPFGQTEVCRFVASFSPKGNG